MENAMLRYIQDILMCDEWEDGEQLLVDECNSVDSVAKELENLLEDGASCVADASFGGGDDLERLPSDEVLDLLLGLQDRSSLDYCQSERLQANLGRDDDPWQEYGGKDFQRRVSCGGRLNEVSGCENGLICFEDESGVCCWHEDPCSELVCQNPPHHFSSSCPKVVDTLLPENIDEDVCRNRNTSGGEQFVAANDNLNENVDSISQNRTKNYSEIQLSEQVSCRRVEPNSFAAANLRKKLLDCARAAETKDLETFNEMVANIGNDAIPSGDCYQRLGFYFLQALLARIGKAGHKMCLEIYTHSSFAVEVLKAYQLFLQKTPYLRIPYFFSTQTILDACKGDQRLHIVDYGILYGVQWSDLIQALADRPEGPPAKVRITGIGFSNRSMKPTEKIEQTANRLAEFARSCGVPFEYRTVRGNWEQISPFDLNIRHDETLIVNCMFRLLYLQDETVAAESPRKRLLKNIRAMNPKMFIEGVMNADYNTPCGFMHRFKAIFDSSLDIFEAIDASIPQHCPERLTIEKTFLGKTIFNVVACEGAERVERPESYRYWQNLTYNAGFKMIPIRSTLYSQIQEMMASNFHRNFGMGRHDEWILIGWKNTPSHAVSAWEPRSIHTTTAGSLTLPPF